MSMHRSMCVVALLAGTAGGVLAAQPGKVELGGKLYKAVFISGPGALTNADLQGLPEQAQKRLALFLARRSAFSSAYESRPDSADAVARDAKRRVIERAIVALVDAPEVERRAVEFVSEAPIAHEWLEYADGPLTEANYAENVLKKEPAGTLAPFLYVFIAHRQRAAFEAAERANNVEVMKAAAKKYRAFIERARAAADPIFGMVADDLDRMPFVNLKSQKHPRDFNPDG
jgi:hypothetical protein